MSHYAKVENGVVTSVIVAEEEFFDTFVDVTPGEWIQTSYNTRGGVHILGGTPLRKNFACVGMLYDTDADAFHHPQPYDSWTLNTETYKWEPPVDYPEDYDPKLYNWNEDTQSWDAVSSD